ncbi:DUF4231 domain-containing protein [Thermosipho globiformans]|uniref:DUF4231 domain-containing protein n=1 Tax=Thermosipho globiformans TaxID=380685 RepID=UPI000F8D1C85|nr:DUF4231 domain-containing protein [Thermosipho globiformans]
MTIEEKDYLEKRFEDQRKYYDKKASLYKKKWEFYSIILVILSPIPLFVLTFVELAWYFKLIIAIASYLSTIFGSLLTLLKYREQWLYYRTTEQELLREYYHYKTLTGPYKDQEENTFKLFVERVESLLAQERSKWLDYIQQQDLPKRS